MTNPIIIFFHLSYSCRVVCSSLHPFRFQLNCCCRPDILQDDDEQKMNLENEIIQSFIQVGSLCNRLISSFHHKNNCIAIPLVICLESSLTLSRFNRLYHLIKQNRGILKHHNILFLLYYKFFHFCKQWFPFFQYIIVFQKINCKTC